MEILKGLSFDIQRFATYNLSDILNVAGATGSDYMYWDGTAFGHNAAYATAAAAGTIVGKYTTVNAAAAILLVGSNTYNISSLASGTNGGTSVAIQIGKDDGTDVVADTSGTLTVANGANQYVLTATGATPGTTFLANGTLSAALTNATLNVSAGSLVTGTGFALAGIGLGSTGKTLASTGNITHALTITSTGTVSGVGSADNVAISGGSTATTVTSGAIALGGAVTVNGDAITFSAAESSGAVTFTVPASAGGNGGVSAVSGVTNGNMLTWGGAPAAGTVSVNTKSYTFATGTAAPVITSTGTNTSSLTTGTVVLSGNASVTTTYHSADIKTTSGYAEVRTTGAGNVPTVLAVTDGTVLTTSEAGISITAAAAFTKEVGKITVNQVEFVQGFDAAGTPNAMSIQTTGSSAYLIGGDAYLAAGKSVTVLDNGAGASAGKTMKVTAKTGDVTIHTTSGTSASIAIGDLDNGDSFTVETGGTVETYTVSNGYLVDTKGNKSAAFFDPTDSTFSQVLNITGLTAGTAFTAAVGTVAVGLQRNESTGVLGTAWDVTNALLGVNVGVTATPTLGSSVEKYTNGNYLHANGLVDANSAEAVGTLSSESGVYTYTATGTKGQIIDLTDTQVTAPAGVDQNTWNITGTSAGDYMLGNGKGTTLNGGAGNDSLIAGNGDIAFGGEGADTIYSAAADVSLSGGAGADTIGATQTSATLTGGDGADAFVLNDGTNTAGRGVITDYNFSEDVLLVDNLTTTQMSGLVAGNFGASGLVSVNGGEVSVNGSNGSYQVVLQNADKKKQAVGWVGEDATAIDASSLNSSALIFGNTNAAGDSLYGGSGADTIYGGAGDTVYGGAGKNQLKLSALAAGDATRTVGVGTGKDTITGFKNGFDAETADKLFIVGELNSLSSTLSGGTLNLKSGDAAVQMNAATAASGGTEVLAGDKKAVFVASGSTVTVGSASYADLYLGTKTGTVGSALNASAIEDAVSIDLSNTNVFKNFTQVTGGQGNTTMIGGKDNETLIAGTGSASLYGGAGKDSLVGNSTAKDTFFMLAGGGSDTVSGFTYYNGDNSDVADVVNMSAISSAKAVSGGVQLNVNDTDKILISGANANSAIGYQVGDSVAVAKVGSVGAANSFTYLKDVNYYGGGNKVDTLSFASGDSDNHQVWLDGSQGVTYASVDVVNGASASGDLVIAGDSAKNTIIGGTGNNSLWGGSGDSADTLRGGTGTNTFFYGLAEGNDTITCGTADDVVNLYNVKLSDVKSGEITNSVVSVELQDGSKLTVNTGSRDIKFNLASGESYTANHSTHNWDA